MPNWCYNRATFTHEDPQQITRLINAAKVGKLFNEFLPMPPELLEEAEQGDDYQTRRDTIIARNEAKYGYPSWYEWSIAHWGTKWDISEVDEDSMQISKDGKSVTFGFDTAWSPPTEWYDNIEGFHINAYYYEPGVGFCGNWNSADGDSQYEVGMDESIDEVSQRIPSDILDEFGIIEEMQSYQEEMQEDEDIFADEDEFVEEIYDIDGELTTEEQLEKIGSEFEELMAQEEAEKGENK